MPHCNALSSGNLLDSNVKCLAPARNFSRGLRFTIPLATTALYVLNSNFAALATDSHISQVVKENETITFSYPGVILNSHDETTHQYENHHHSSGFLSSLLNFFPSSVQAYLTRLLPVASFEQLESLETSHNDGMGGSLVQDFVPLYLSQAESFYPQQFFQIKTTNFISATNTNEKSTLTQAPNQKLYTVKTGDTISRIATQHQVSRQELIELNQIQNSNIIFVNQTLKLPTEKINQVESPAISLTKTDLPHDAARKIANRDITASNWSNFKAETKNTSKNKSDISKLNPHNHHAHDNLQENRLTKLRAEIEQMRSEIQQERTDLVASSTDSDIVDVASTLESPVNSNLDSISSDAVSLQLPPLPASDEYLPEAFDGYTWPANGVLSSGYGWRWGRLHKGIDIAAPVGTPIYAAAAGEVISAGWNSGGYGNLVKLQHLDGSMTLYAHNHRILVSNGQKVNQGEQIAEMGNTGFSTGSHLHFEIHSKNRGIVNPLALLNR